MSGRFRLQHSILRHISSKRLEISIVLLLVGWAAYIRLIRVGLYYFNLDEAALSLSALNMARHGEVARIGIRSSAGIPNTPAAVWLLSIPYALTTNPEVVTLVIIVMNWLALIALWWLARRIWGVWGGLGTLAYLVAHPYSILYSRNIWAQNLLIPLGVLWIWLAYLAWQTTHSRRRAVMIILHLVIAVFSFQVHPAGAGYILASLGFVALLEWWRYPRILLISGGLALSSIIPYVQYIACCATEVWEQYLDIYHQPSQFDFVAVKNLFQIGVAREWNFFLGDYTGYRLTEIITAIVLLLGLVNIAYYHIKRSQRIWDTIVLWWGISTILLFLSHKTPVFIHYQLIGLPALGLVFGVAFAMTPYRVMKIGGLIAMLGVNLIWSGQVQEVLQRFENGELPSMPLNYHQSVVEQVPEDTPLVVFTHSDEVYSSGEATLWTVLTWGRPARVVNGAVELILPQEPTYLLFELPYFQAWEALDMSGITLPASFYDRPGNRPPMILAQYDPTPPTEYTQFETPIEFAHGIQFNGWQVGVIGDRMRILTWWNAPEVVPYNTTYAQFHHLRTADNLDPQQPPNLVSDVPVSVERWHIGDWIIVISDFQGEIPDEFWLDIGHYTHAPPQRMGIIDSDSDFVRLGPIQSPLLQ